MLDTLNDIRDHPDETIILHDYDGIIAKDGMEDMFPAFKDLWNGEVQELEFWRDFLEPFYQARERKMFVRLTEEKRVDMVHVNGRVPFIGDELLLFHHALIAGQKADVVKSVIDGDIGYCLVNETAHEEIPRLRERFKHVAIVSGNFLECQWEILKSLGFRMSGIYSTQMLEQVYDGCVMPLERMTGSGTGKICVLETMIKKNDSRYAVIIDDGTTGINYVIYSSKRDGCIAICPNPNIPMMRNVPEAIYLLTPDLADICRLLEGEIEPVTFSEWERNPKYETPLAVYVNPEDDIGVERTENFYMPYGFVGYDCEPEEGSLADYVCRVRKETDRGLVIFNDI